MDWSAMKAYLVSAHGRIVTVHLDDTGDAFDRAKASADAHDGVVIEGAIVYDARHGRTAELVADAR